MNVFPLYIDPGTGSALFSVLIGVAATLYFLSRALFIKLKVFLSGGKVTSASSGEYSYAIYNEGKQYWNVFKPVLDEFENRNIPILYLSSSEDDPVFSFSWNFIKPEYIGEGNKAFARLNMLKTEICLMTTPGLNVYQLKRSKMTKHYSHVLHAPTDATRYRLFGIDYFDSVLLTGDYQAADIRFLEQERNIPKKKLLAVGCTYLDEYAEKLKGVQKEENHPFTVLVSPSWGPSALLSKYGEKLLEPLTKTGFRIIVRPHPQSRISETEMLAKLEAVYAGRLVWDYDGENIHSLSKADIMISDFSGIIFDYIFLFDRPVMYVRQAFDTSIYDADDLGENAAEKLWQFKILKEIGLELKEADFPRLHGIIQNAFESESLKEARKKARETAWQYPGEAGKRIADFMIETVNNLDNSH